MLREDLEVEMVAKVKQSLKPDPAEALVTNALNLAEERRRWSGKSSELRQPWRMRQRAAPQLAGTECLAAGKERGVRILPIGQVYVAVGGTKDRGR